MSDQPVNYKFFFDLRLEVDALRRDMDALQAEVKGLFNLITHNDDLYEKLAKYHAGRFKFVYEYLNILQDQVAPLEAEIFPSVSDARAQLARIIDEQRNKPDETPKTGEGPARA